MGTTRVSSCDVQGEATDGLGRPGLNSSSVIYYMCHLFGGGGGGELYLLPTQKTLHKGKENSFIIF